MQVPEKPMTRCTGFTYCGAKLFNNYQGPRAFTFDPANLLAVRQALADRAKQVHRGRDEN